MKTLRAAALVLLAFTVPVACGQQSSNMPRGDYQISGIVVDSISRQPLGGVSVVIAPVATRDAYKTTKTGPDGLFSFAEVARGKYSLAAGKRGYPTQGFDQHEAYTTAIVAGPQQETQNIVFNLHPEGSIRGKATDEENDPVQNATVRLFATRTQEGRTTTKAVRQVMTDDQGNFSFAHLPQATYYIAISGRPWYSNIAPRRWTQLPRISLTSDPGDSSQPSSSEDQVDQADSLDKVYPLTFFSAALTSADATPIHLQPGESFSADVTLRAVPAVHLKLPSEPRNAVAAGSDNSPEPRIGSGLPRVSAVALFQNVFEGTLLPVESSVVGGFDGLEVTGFAAGHYLMQISNNSAPGLSSRESKPEGSYQELEIEGDMDLPALSLPTARVSGIAQFTDKRPTPGLTLVLANPQTSRFYGTRIPDDGAIKFDEAILPGTYEVSVGDAPDVYLQSISVTGAKLSGRLLQIKGSDSVHLSLVVGHGLAQIDGVALREGGKPCAGAMILLVPSSAGNSWVLVRRDQSDSDGTFTLRTVVPGRYSLLAIENGWKLAWTDPKVLAPYMRTAASIQVSPGAKLQFTVVAQSSGENHTPADR